MRRPSRRAPAVRRLVTLVAALALVTGIVPGVGASHTGTPASVTIAGSLQEELGCPGDWQPECAGTHLAYDATDDVWQGTWLVPAGNWEYKAALNGAWTENYGLHAQPDGPNIGLQQGEASSLKFYYDHKSHWITDNRTERIVTAPGDFQSELGCGGDWQPDCLRSWLQDVDGDGIYEFTTTALPAGNYEVKAAVNESWDENYGQGGAPGGANIPFRVGASGQRVTFRFVSSTNTLTVQTSASHDGNVWWDDLRHDSRDPLYRNPGGAVPAGTPVTLRLRAASGDLTEARVRVWNDRTDTQSILAMSRVADDGEHEWWQATVPASAQPTIYWYRFIARDGNATAFYEDNPRRTGGIGHTLPSTADRSWQLTVYDPDFRTPDWVKNAVIYQVFPDRFRNGDAANDPAPGQFFYDETPTRYRSGTTTAGDWNTPICDPRDAGGTCPGVYSQNFYGGDLQGLRDKLGYLEELGVTALYLNPIFDSPSNHKYDTTDFTQVDPSFGGQAALEELAADAHARGMRLILDGVFNHTSSDSIYFDRYGRYGGDPGACESASSPYRDWYFFTPVTSGTGTCAGDDGTPAAANYTSWFGFESLPKLRSSNAEVRDFFYAGGANAVGPYWLTWADGWRLDVAGDVDPGLTNEPANDYWEGFRAAVRAADPDAYIVGEEWGLATAWTLGSEWDATMNYQLSSALLSFWRDEPFTDNDHNSGSSAGVLEPLSPSQLTERILNLEERYPPEAFAALMNLLGSHDTNRPLFMLDENADEAGTTRATYENPSYDWSDAITRLKGVVLLQATLPGAPTIYYGDEVGLVAPPTKDGSGWQDDPYNRIPYPWLDETGTPFYPHLQTEAGQAQVLDYYTLVFNTRNDHPALRTGTLDPLLADDAARTFAYGRKTADGSDAAVVAVNRSDSPEAVTLDVAGYLPVGTQLTDALAGGEVHTVDAAGELHLSLPARGGALLVLAGAMASPPATVTDLAVVGTGPSHIELDWSAAAGADSYDVYRSILSGGGYELVGSTTSTGYTDSGLQTGATFYYVVVSRDETTLLTGGQSNEAAGTTGHDLGDPGSSWFNLQWPPSITHTISATTRTENIYGRIWVSGATEAPGQAPGIRGQVGFGPDGSQPGPGWTWEEMAFNVQVDNNDEYVGSLLPDAVGSFDYAVRWSADGGQTWYLADIDGPQRDGTLDNPGALTVNASGDGTPPSAPELSLAGVTASSVSLEWTASTDGVALAGYEVIRDGVEIAHVDASTTAYVDETVTTGESYAYVVRAFDTSFNRSPDSNEVTVTAENRVVEVTFRVGVPADTPSSATVYVTGSIAQLGPWNPGAFPMSEASPGVWQRTFQVPDGTQFEWKYTRGSWDTVEWWGSITGLANRGPITVDYGADGTLLVDNTATDWGSGPDGEKAVQAWRDPYVTGHAPSDGATGVPVDATVSVEWSQPMDAGTTFSVSGPGGPVAGAFARSNGDRTVTFTPDADLDWSTTYQVAATGQRDTEGDVQQVPASFSFTTAEQPAVTLVSIAVSPQDPTLIKKQKQAFTATGSYSDGSQSDVTGSVVWATSNKKVVAIDRRGLADAKGVGTAVISARLDDVVGQSTATVLTNK